MNLLKAHNIKLYHKMCDCLEKKGSACVILGTGLGKTTTALQYLHDHHVRGLVIVPNNTVKKSWAITCCDCITYSYFMQHYKDILYQNYGLVILDEVHHIGAAKWGYGVKWLLGTSLIPVLGLTATPTRSDMIDIRDFFGDCVCAGLDVMEGIKQDVLYPFNYVGAYYDANEIVEHAKTHYNKLDIRLKGMLDIALNNTPSVKKIIQNNMPSGIRKGIIFVSRIDEMEEAKTLIKSIYPNVPVEKLHSKMNYKAIQHITEWFYEIKEGYLITVYMMGEGAHYPNVNTLIMLRRTKSNLVFTQQLGRCLTLTDEERSGDAIVFDLVNNAQNLREFHHKYQQTLKERSKLRKAPCYSDQVILKSYTQEIDEILKQIKELYGYGWSEEEDKILIEKYPEHGANIPELKHKSSRTILRQARLLGLTTSHQRISEEDKKIIIEYYPTEGAQCIDRLSVRRTPTYTSKFARKIGLKFEPGRKVKCVETGTVYRSAAEAGRELGVKGSRILGCASGKPEHNTAAGCHWEFV